VVCFLWYLGCGLVVMAGGNGARYAIGTMPLRQSLPEEEGRLFISILSFSVFLGIFRRIKTL